MEALLPYLQLVNLAIIPASVALFRLVRVLDKMESFMEESRADRRVIHAKLDPIERALVAKGLIQ